MGAVTFVVWTLCIVLSTAGYAAAGIFIISLTAYAYFGHSRSIGRPAKRAIRRPGPELRRILAIDHLRKSIEDR